MHLVDDNHLIGSDQVSVNECDKNEERYDVGIRDTMKVKRNQCLEHHVTGGRAQWQYRAVEMLEMLKR